MEKQKSENEIVFYSDGGSRGNPGPAAAGVFFPQFGKEYSKFLGRATNNEAEYQAVILGLRKIKQLVGKDKSEKSEVEVRADSELIVKQLNGEYKMKEEKLIPFFMEIWNLKQEFKKVYFVHILREENKRADAAVNRELDSQGQGSRLF